MNLISTSLGLAFQQREREIDGEGKKKIGRQTEMKGVTLSSAELKSCSLNEPMLEELGWFLFLDVTFVLFSSQKETFWSIFWLIKEELCDGESLLKILGILLITTTIIIVEKGQKYYKIHWL